MKYESAAAGEEKTSGCEVNKVGADSYQKIRDKKAKLPTQKMLDVYRCDLWFSTKHIKEYKALKTKCSNCNKIDYFNTKMQTTLTTQKNRKI